MEENNYFKVKALSFSSLKNLLESPALFLGMLNKKPSSEALTIGNLVDALLTERDRFDELFLLKKAKEPSGLMLPYVEALLRNDGNFEKAYLESGYKQSEASIREKFEKEGKEWYNEQLELKTSSKSLYTQEEYSRAIAVVSSLQNNKFIAQCFEISNENEEIFKQLEIYWKYKGIDLKSKLDVVKINRKNKKIILYDLKTTGYSVNSFYDSVIKYSYWLQMSMYGMAIYHYFKDKIENIKEYDIEFKWIVESTKYPGSPIIYNMSKEDADKGVNGGKIDGKYVKGFIQLIEDYIWYTETNQWTHKREIIENNFECDISIFN